MAAGKMYAVGTKESERPMIKGAMKQPKRKPKKGKTQVTKVQNQVAELRRRLNMNTEWKNFDIVQTALSTAGWSFTDVSSIFFPAQGDGRSERIGDNCMLKSVDLRYHVVQVDPTDIGLVRVVVWIDKQNNASLASIFDSGFTTGTLAAPFSHYSRDNKATYEILYDVTHEVDGVNSVQDFVRVKIPINRNVRFENTLTTVKENMLKIGFISNTSNASADIFYQFCSRCWYTD